MRAVVAGLASRLSNLVPALVKALIVPSSLLNALPRLDGAESGRPHAAPAGADAHGPHGILQTFADASSCREGGRHPGGRRPPVFVLAPMVAFAAAHRVFGGHPLWAQYSSLQDLNIGLIYIAAVTGLTCPRLPDGGLVFQ